MQKKVHEVTTTTTTLMASLIQHVLRYTFNSHDRGKRAQVNLIDNPPQFLSNLLYDGVSS